MKSPSDMKSQRIFLNSFSCEFWTRIADSSKSSQEERKQDQEGSEARDPRSKR